MEFKINLFPKMCLLLAGTMALVSSCQDYEPFSDETLQDKAYTHEFVKQFGEIDPDQNWDLYGQLSWGHRNRPMTRAASPSSVNVETEEYSYIVYQQDATVYQKVLPESNAGGNSYSQTNLGRVTQDFITTAREFTMAQVHYTTSGNDRIGIYWYADPGDPGATTVQKNGETYWIQRKEIYVNKTGVVGRMHIQYYNSIYIVWADFDDLQAYAPARYVIADGTTNYRNASGGAWENGTKLFDTGNTWTDQNTGQTYKVWDYFREGESYYLPDIIKNDMRAIHPDYLTADGSDTYKDKNGYTITGGSFVTYEEEVVDAPQVNQYGQTDNLSSEYFFNGGAEFLRCDIIHVEVPDDIPYYGFYIQNGNWGGGTRYSESKLNDPVMFPGEYRSRPGCYVATFDIHDIDPSMKSQQYLCFEDWMNATNFDLNDLVFTISLDPMSIIDHEETNEYALLVCEDLATFDFDFNDDVLLLNYKDGVSREYHTDGFGNVTSVEVTPDIPELSITALAAGGAFESTVYYGIPSQNTGSTPDPTAGQTRWGEIHALLNETGTHDVHNHTIINAGPEYGELGQKITVPANQLPGKNVMPTGTYPTYLSQLFDQGFITIVCEEDYAKALTSNNSYKDKSSGVDENQMAPQMMLLPAYFEWPQEMVHIKEAYEDFADWVQDVNQTHWIISSQIAKNITDRGDLWTETIQGTEVVSKTLPTSTGHDFTYTDKHGNTTTYHNCAKVDFTYFKNEYPLQSEDYAKLTITYSTKPDATVYLDFADGKQFIEDKSGATGITETYTLAKSQLQEAIESGAVYFMAPNSEEVVISTAELTVYR